MRFKYILLLLFSLIVNAQATKAEDNVNSECASALVNWDNYDVTLHSLNKAYRRANFLELETALECLMAPNYGFPSGNPGATAVYWLFNANSSGPADISKRLELIDKWKTSNTESKYPEYAIAATMYQKAWLARGGNFASDTSKGRAERFREILVETENKILSFDYELLNTPISQTLLIAVTWDIKLSGASGGTNSPWEVFNSAVIQWPYYYGLYKFMLYRLVPNWGGTMKKVDDFITENSRQIEDDGNSLYARLYNSVIGHHTDPGITLISWPLMKESLADLVSIYPTDYHKILAASYSCFYNEKDLYRSYMKSLSPKSKLHSDAWVKGTSKFICETKLSR